VSLLVLVLFSFVNISLVIGQEGSVM